MESFTVSGNIRLSHVSQPPARKYYRVMTDREIWENKIVVPGHGQFYHASGPDWRAGFPAVFWLFGGTKVTFTDAQQYLSWDMVKGVMTSKKWRVVYDDHRAFMNGTGFDTDGTGSPRRDVINQVDLSAPLPQWDKVRVCADAILSGVEDGDMLIVDTLNPDNPPTWEQLQPNKHLYFKAVSSTQTGDTTSFPQGDPCYIPLFARTAVRFPLSALVRL